MALEQERRFLVNYMPTDSDQYPTQDIKQGYIIANKAEQFRIRIAKDLYAEFTYKAHINDTDKEEIEVLVDYEKALTIYNTMKGLTKVHKIRTKYYGWDIDFYPDFKITLAEFEYSLPNPMPNPTPSWIGREVTGEYKYTNIAMANGDYDKIEI